MDSLTQIALGATVAHTVMGRHAGRAALAWGAALGTLPDLDVLIPLADPVAAFTYHRSASHSLIVLTLLTPLLAELIRRCHKDTGHLRWRWLWMVWLVLVTHVLLDALTVYGTQLFWPLTDYPVSGSVVFIIDPFYTVPLLAGLVGALWARQSATSLRWSAIGLAISSCYLVWGIGAKAWVDHRVQGYLASHEVAHTRVMSTATPFNTLLWRLVVMTEDGYLEGFYSLLDGHGAPTFTAHSSKTALLDDLGPHWPVARLARFTHGFYSVDRAPDGGVVMTDLRMGLRGHYAFAFQIAEQHPDGTVTPVASRRARTALMSRELGWLWARLLKANPD